MEASDEVVIRSLRRSRIRVAVLMFIAQSFFRQASLKELQKGLNICASNILGAIMGDGRRYKVEDSLISMGLLERAETYMGGFTIICYRLTEKGAYIVAILEKESRINAILGEIMEWP